MTRIYVIILIALMSLSCSVPNLESKHLFILSGQSNMVGLKPGESFLPMVEAEFGAENVLVVKYASNGQPIRRWYKAWRPEKGGDSAGVGDLYDILISKVYKTTGGRPLDGIEFKSVTFVWMQGEQDAMEEYGLVYFSSLNGLLDQLETDLGRSDINFVVGRLSDYDLDNSRYPHWIIVREAQVTFASTYKRGAWVDTDDLNDGLNSSGNDVTNDLHYSRDGYFLLGQRFAEAAISLINDNP